MPRQIIANDIELVINALRAGVTYAYVTNWRVAGVPTNAQVIDVAQQAYLTLLPRLIGLHNNQVVFNSATAKSMDAGSTFEYTQPFSTGNVGTRGNNVAPGNLAKAVKWTSDHSGRSGEGHTYFGGLLTSDVSGDFMASLIMLALTGLANFLVGYTTPTGAHLAVGSRKLHLGYPVYGFVLNNLVNDIGRRLIGRGRHD